MTPADGNNIQVAIAIQIIDLRAIVMFICDMDNMPGSVQPLAIDILKPEQPRGFGRDQVVLADNDITISIPIHICNIQAHRSGYPGNKMFMPKTFNSA